MRSHDLIPLPLVDGKVSEMTGRRGPGYPRIYGAVLKGDLPVVRQGGRIYARPDDLPVIAAYFGMDAAAEHAA